MRRLRHRLALSAAVLIAMMAGSRAEAERPTPPLPPPSPQKHEPVPPPDDGRLDRLAEIMGTLAFMRDLCNAGDGPAWRDKMSSLLEAEGDTAIRKERLAGSFNRGYEGYRLMYRSCTPAAQAVIARALSEGERVSADLAASLGVQ